VTTIEDATGARKHTRIVRFQFREMSSISSPYLVFFARSSG
jgi:hypothetical protein